MHLDLCRFLSEAFHDERLLAEMGNERQDLILNPDADPALEANDIRLVGIEHEGCSKKSESEASDVGDHRVFQRLANARIAGSE
jgi:hypothetical protein